MSGSRTIPFRSLTITPHIESVCVNNTRTSLTNCDKRASSLLYLGSMASNSTSVSANRSQIISPYKISARGGLSLRSSCKLPHAGIPNQSDLYESEADHDL